MAGEIDQYDAIARKIASTRIQTWRDSQDLSQTDVATKIGISEKGFRNYELGTRVLPLSVRLKFIDQFQFDPVPTDLLYQELGLPEPGPSHLAYPATMDRQDFWKNLRAESRLFRKNNYSRPAQIMLSGRDQIYAGSTFYFALKNLSLMLDVPYGLVIDGTDWIFIISFALILLLMPTVIAEMPLVKVTRHILKR